MWTSIRLWFGATLRELVLTLGGVVISALGAVALIARFDLPLFSAETYAIGGLALLIVASIRNFHAMRVRLIDVEAREDARLVSGSVEMAPLLIVEDIIRRDDGANIGFTFQAGLHLANRGHAAIRYRVQRFDARVEGHIQLSGDSGSSYPVAPGDYMANRGPAGFGPHVINGFIDGEFVVEVRLAPTFGSSTVVEQRRLTFMAQVYDDGPGGNRGVHMGEFSAASGPDRHVRANIDDPGADWRLDGALAPPAATGGPMRTIAQLQPGQTSNDAFGYPPGTLPNDPYRPEIEVKPTRQQRRSAARKGAERHPDPRDEYSEGK